MLLGPLVLLLDVAAISTVASAGAARGSAGAPASAVISVDAQSSTHRVNPLFMGCHSDSGFGHQVRSFYSNLLFGESFEPGAPGSWQQHLLPPTASANISMEGKGEGMHGQTALKIVYRSGTGLVGLGNRGFRNEGIPLRAGLEYQGYLFVRSAAAVTVNVSLRRYTPNSTLRSVLASVQLPVAATGGNWTQLNYSLVPNDDAPCEGVSTPDPDLHCCSTDLGNSTCHGNSLGHVCIRCLGEFAVGLTGPGEALIDFVFLQPGEWGRYKGLPVHRKTVETLQEMGVTAIRFGGSFVSYVVRPIVSASCFVCLGHHDYSRLVGHNIPDLWE